MSSIVLLPSPHWLERPALVAAVNSALVATPGTAQQQTTRELIDLDLSSSTSLAAQTCAELHRTPPTAGPITIVAAADGAELLPQVANAVRAARRSIDQYVLIDPSTDPRGTDWPDAPVAVFSKDPELSRRCTLRGWEVSELASVEECARWICARSS